MGVPLSRLVKRHLFRVAFNQLPRKGPKYNGAFQGDDAGNWTLGGYLRSGEWDWDAALSLANYNDRKNLMVEGATEHHAGFLKALHEMVREYPELGDFVVKFDGPWIPVPKLLTQHAAESREPDWARMHFYHGTSSTAAERIVVEGLKPRSQTNVDPAYGVGSNAGAGRAEAIYLTTQLGMAKFAALDAAKAHHGDGVILEVIGLNPDFVAADEDSKQTSAAASLARIGSIAYLAPIAASKIQVILRAEKSGWIPVK